jgi:hypothetical protein
MNAATPNRIAVAGAGYIGQAHVRVIQDSPNGCRAHRPGRASGSLTLARKATRSI